jgi:hypothetical protein
MDTDFNLIKSVRAKFPRPPRIINDGNLRDVKMGYVGGYFGKKYLYVKYFGKSVNEYQSNPSAHRTFLEVFDLEGNPVVRYRLGGMSTHHFVVDEETFTLYGATHDDTVEDALVVYQLIGLQ